MLKALVTAGAYTSGNVPCTIYKNTNGKYELNNGFRIHTDGLTDVKANIIVEATAVGDLSLQAYADGIPVAGAIDTQTVAVGDTYTFHINDIVKTVFSQASTFATITLAFSEACTLVGGDVILTYER